MNLRAICFLVAMVAAGPASAVQPDEVLPNPVLEARARTISAGLRCLVCQNQSIDDSAAPLARDLRLIVRERLQAGDSDGAVRAFLVARYGDFVLLKPPFNAGTALLWLTPALVLVAGGATAWMARRSRDRADAPPLSADERAAIDAVIRDSRS